ncbi:MAG: hypothetical protein GDA56_04150 [Hormoscilla sp. GM7CHS1pb]|nr:hypothetical protein [Hormoscilla sp. GM7CHS1pb]
MSNGDVGCSQYDWIRRSQQGTLPQSGGDRAKLTDKHQGRSREHILLRYITPLSPGVISICKYKTIPSLVPSFPVSGRERNFEALPRVHLTFSIGYIHKYEMHPNML